MQPKCIQAVTKAAGRALSNAEIKGIDDNINATMKRMSVDDPQWASYPKDVRVQVAAQQIMADMKAAAARKVENAQRQVIKTAETNQRIESLMQSMGIGRRSALGKSIENTYLQANAVRDQYFSGLTDLIEGLASKSGVGYGRRALQFLFDAENPIMARDVVREIFANGDGHTGNTLAKAGAQAWLKVIETMRTRFNDAGGDVGKLDYGYIPQPHNAIKIKAAGAEPWAAKVLDLLDRNRYRDVDGRRLNDAEVLDMLRAAHETLASDGMNKQTPGQFKGPGAKANAGSDSRVLHFKDGDAYLAYNAEFGKGSMYEAMIGHVSALSKSIAMVEDMGPNPNQQFRLQLDLAKQDDPVANKLGAELGDRAIGPEPMWALLNGGSGPMANLGLVGSTLRNINVFGKLAGALISSITDVGTVFLSTGYNKIPYWQVLEQVGTSRSKEALDFMATHGLIADSLISGLKFFHDENIAQGWSSRLANSTMKLSLMNAWTNAWRGGFAMAMMRKMGELSRKQWGDLTEFDRYHMGKRGITEEDWAVVNAAQLTDYKGHGMLTSEAIEAAGSPEAAQAAKRIQAFITDESEYAVINPDLTTRAIQTWGGHQAGTGMGELSRTMMQFKSFPIAMITRHWARALEGRKTAGMEGAPLIAKPGAYSVALVVSSAALGAIVVQAKQMLQGKDPIDTTRGKFWAQAFGQGGGMGYATNVLFNDTTQDRSPLESFSKLIVGPSFGTAADLYELTKGNIDETMAGKDSHFGAEAIQLIKGHTPYVNLWYGKSAFEHLLLHNAQEAVSPGYLERVQNKARKDWGQEYYWAPGDAMPERAPDLSAMGGK